MNIFLDSNILYQDYFFETKSVKKILEYSENELIKLYMSEIVRLELRRQFQKEIEAKNKELKTVIKDNTRLKLDADISLLDVDSQLSKFDKYYQTLQDNEYIEIIHYKNEYLPDIVDRAILRKKPFTESKTELKDALIWKSYSEFVEANKLDECILLTNNTSDFCTKKNKTKVHPDLLKDTERFTVINSSFEFIKSKAKILESVSHRFSLYIDGLEIDNNFVYDLINDNFNDDINSEIDELISTLEISDILGDEYIMEGYVTGEYSEIVECSDIEIEKLTDSALISGTVTVTCDSECYYHNWGRDRGEESYELLSSQAISVNIYFNFDMGDGEVCSDFEITDFEIISIDNYNA